MPAKKYFTDEERKAAKVARQWKYIHSDNGKEKTAKYNLSIKEKKTNYRFANKDKIAIYARQRRLARKVYVNSEAAQENRKRRRDKRRNSYQPIIWKPHECHLYIMAVDRFPGEFKVGRSSKPTSRAAELSAGYPWQVNVVKVFEGFGFCESMLHTELEAFMTTTESKPRTEWFRLPYEELVEKINSVLSQFEH